MKLYFSALAAVTLLFASCYGDNGNYDYHPVNEVEISGIETAGYNKIAFIDELTIIPKITTTLNGDRLDDLEYEWKIIPHSANDDNDGEGVDYTVSREKDLSLPITLKAGDYNCFYIVRDKSTGLEWRRAFPLKVRSVTSEGWMILCDADGKGRLDLVFNDTEENDMIVRDLWRELPLVTHNPRKLLFNYGLYSCDIMYVCDEGTYRLSIGDLSLSEGSNLKYSFGAPPDKVIVEGAGKPQFGNETNYWTIIDDNGDIYWADIYDVGSVFAFPMNRIGGQEYFRAAPFVGITFVSSYWGASLMLYDATNRRFLEVVDGASFPSVMKFADGHMFAAETGRDMVHLESTKGGYNYAILKDPDADRYYFYCIEMNADGKNYQKFYGEIKGEGLDRVKQFACHHMNTMPYLFYSTDHKVYQFDMAHPDTPAKEALSFSGETVQVIKFTPYVAWEAYQDWERARNYQLVVGTNVDGADPESCGIMRRYEVPNLMGDLVKVKEHTELGRIVDITYRERGRQ